MDANGIYLRVNSFQSKIKQMRKQIEIEDVQEMNEDFIAAVVVVVVVVDVVVEVVEAAGVVVL